MQGSGTLKLANFGLTKTLPFEMESMFRLSDETCSFRYMAPELFRHEPYDLKVHSPALPTAPYLHT